jgi:hypothetical protein
VGRAFGPRAERWLRHLGDAPVLLTDFERIPEALSAALALRTQGMHFYVGVAYEEPRAAMAVPVVQQIFSQPRSREQIVTLLDGYGAGVLLISDRPQAQFEAVSMPHVHAGGDLLRLADGLIVRSWAEQARLRTVFEWLPRRTLVDVRPHSIPVPVAAPMRDRVVVWMPDASIERALLLAFALDELHYETLVVCDAAVNFTGLRAQFAGRAQGAEALGRAFALVDGDLDDPGASLALASLGLPLTVPATTGAAQWTDNVTVYDPTLRRTLPLAVQDAIGLGPAGLAAAAIGALAQLQAGRTIALEAPWPTTGPLVSIVVRTYNRKRFLRRALRSVRAQTYRNIETIVVNDAGESVEDIVAEFPGVKLIQHETNRGLAEARNSGVAAATGLYLGFLDDDDAYMPEHVATLVAALGRSNAVIAYGTAISQFVRRQPDESYRTYGIRTEFPATINSVDLLSVNSFPPVAMLLRRDALVAAGRFEAWAEPMEDHEMWLRMLLKGDVTHVDHVTSIYSRRDDGSNLIDASWPKHGPVLSAIHARYPVADRPDIDARRAAVIGGTKAVRPPVSELPFTYDEPFPL